MKLRASAPANAALLSLPRPPERTHPKIQKHHDNHRRRQKRPMIRPMLPALPRPPQHRCKHQHRQQKENADNLQQDFSAHSFKWLEKSRHAAAHIFGCLSRGAPAPLCTWRDTLLHARRRALRILAHDGLSCHPARHAQSDPKHPSDSLRSHFDMMVAAADISPPPCIQRRMPVAGAPLAK